MTVVDEEWQKASEEYRKAFEDIAKQQEKYWNSFTTEQQIDLFCSVVRRLVKGELEEKRSYRGVLYDTFGFDLSAYSLALNAGFMELHNAIFSEDYDRRLLRLFAQAIKLPNPLESVDKFLTDEIENAKSTD